MSCYDGLDWAALVDSGYPDLKGHEAEVYGLWRYEIRQVALPARAQGAGRVAPSARGSPQRLDLRARPRAHAAEQSDAYNAPRSRPFNEVEADCGGFAKFGRLRHALGIKRHMQPPPRGFARCPLKRAVGGRP